MASIEIMRGCEIDLNQLIDQFAEEVQSGKISICFESFKNFWKSKHMSFIIVTAPQMNEIENYVQNLFMIVLDRFEIPSPFKHPKIYDYCKFSPRIISGQKLSECIGLNKKADKVHTKYFFDEYDAIKEDTLCDYTLQFRHSLSPPSRHLPADMAIDEPSGSMAYTSLHSLDQFQLQKNLNENYFENESSFDFNQIFADTDFNYSGNSDLNPEISENIQDCLADNKNVFEENKDLGVNDQFESFSEPYENFNTEALASLISFEEKVAAIYALYCLYKIQCLGPRLLIHVPIECLKKITQFLPQLLDANIPDPLYIFKQLWEENAFVIGVLKRPPRFIPLAQDPPQQEISAYRELYFHMKTTSKVLGDFDEAIDLCNKYKQSREKLNNSKLLKGTPLELTDFFDTGVGEWMKNIAALEHNTVMKCVHSCKDQPKPLEKTKKRNIDISNDEDIRKQKTIKIDESKKKNVKNGYISQKANYKKTITSLPHSIQNNISSIDNTIGCGMVSGSSIVKAREKNLIEDILTQDIIDEYFNSEDTRSSARNLGQKSTAFSKSISNYSLSALVRSNRGDGMTENFNTTDILNEAISEMETSAGGAMSKRWRGVEGIWKEEEEERLHGEVKVLVSEFEGIEKMLESENDEN